MANRVYIKDATYAWLPAEILSNNAQGDDTVPVRITLPADWGSCTSSPNHSSLQRYTHTQMVRLSDYAHNYPPLQNLGEDGKFLDKSDLADLPHLHEAAILYNLKDRHKRGVPYTRVRDIVVAVNPYQVRYDLL